MKKLLALTLSLVIAFSLVACGGNGGGKPDSAMGGGKDASKLTEALASVEGFIASKF